MKFIISIIPIVCIIIACGAYYNLIRCRNESLREKIEGYFFVTLLGGVEGIFISIIIWGIYYLFN